MRPRCPECDRLCVRHCPTRQCNWVRCGRRAHLGGPCGFGVWTGDAWKQWAWYGARPERKEVTPDAEG